VKKRYGVVLAFKGIGSITFLKNAFKTFAGKTRPSQK
jgi:hypothetical protein